jgi:hypothetical protein
MLYRERQCHIAGHDMERCKGMSGKQEKGTLRHRSRDRSQVLQSS